MDFLSAPNRPPKFEWQKLNVGEFLTALRLRDICRLSDRGRRRGEIFLFNQPGHQKEGGGEFLLNRAYLSCHTHSREGRENFRESVGTLRAARGKIKKFPTFTCLLLLAGCWKMGSSGSRNFDRRSPFLYGTKKDPFLTDEQGSSSLFIPP